MVDPDELIGKAATKGFRLVGKEENHLPNGKSLISFHFMT
jgi:hypothetical protein